MRAIFLLRKEEKMKKIIFVMVLIGVPLVLGACTTKCETEPIVEQNHKLIVPPNFGQMPK